MKRSILILFVFAIIYSGIAQVTRSSVYLIQDATTSFGIQIWSGSLITDISNNKTYLITEAAAANQTLETTTGKTEITSNGINVWDDGVLKVSEASTLNFTGAGVAASDGGSGIATVNIPGGDGGGGGGTTCLTNEVCILDYIDEQAVDDTPAFVAAFQSDKNVLIIPKGTYRIGTDLIVPPGKTMAFEQGAELDIRATITLNETGISAGNHMIFYNSTRSGGSSAIRFFNGSANIGAWKADWFIDFSTAIEEVIYPYRLELAARTYQVNRTVYQENDIVLRGRGTESIVDINDNYFWLRNSIIVNSVTFTNGKVNYGIRLDQASSATEEDITIEFRDCYFINMDKAINTGSYQSQYGGVQDIIIEGCTFDNVRYSIDIKTRLKGGAFIRNNIFKDYVQPSDASEFYCIALGESSDLNLVEGVIVSGNEAYGYEVGNTTVTNQKSIFLRCYASDILVTNNYLHDSRQNPAVAGRNQKIDGFYMHGDNNKVEGNIVVNWQRSGGHTLIFKPNHMNIGGIPLPDSGAYSVCRDNQFINTSPDVDHLDQIIYGDGAIKVEGNYIYTDDQNRSSEYVDVYWGFSYETENPKGVFAYFSNNAILTNRMGLRVGNDANANRVARTVFKINDNYFYNIKSTQRRTSAQHNTMIVDDYIGQGMFTKVLLIRDNIFRLTNGISPFRLESEHEVIRIEGNDIEMKYDTNYYDRNVRLIQTGGHWARHFYFKDNNVVLQGVPVIGEMGHKNMFIENNVFEFDYQKTTGNSTAPPNIITLSGAGEGKFHFDNNTVLFSDTTYIDYTSTQPILINQTVDYRLITFLNNWVEVKNLPKRLQNAYKKNGTFKLVFEDNYWSGFYRLMEGYGTVYNWYLEKETVRDVYEYYYSFSTTENLYLEALDIATTGNSFTFRGNCDNLFFGYNVNIDSDNFDFEIRQDIVLANVYGLTSGQEYSGNIKDPGYIDNIWGVRAVGVDNQNEFTNAKIGNLLQLQLLDAAPTEPQEGMIYINSSDRHIYCYLNGAWKRMDN